MGDDLVTLFTNEDGVWIRSDSSPDLDLGGIQLAVLEDIATRFVVGNELVEGLLRSHLALLAGALLNILTEICGVHLGRAILNYQGSLIFVDQGFGGVLGLLSQATKKDLGSLVTLEVGGRDGIRLWELNPGITMSVIHPVS